MEILLFVWKLFMTDPAPDLQMMMATITYRDETCCLSRWNGFVDSIYRIINEADAVLDFEMRRTESNINNDVFRWETCFVEHFTVSNISTTSQSSFFPHHNHYIPTMAQPLRRTSWFNIALCVLDCFKSWVCHIVRVDCLWLSCTYWAVHEERKEFRRI